MLESELLGTYNRGQMTELTLKNGGMPDLFTFSLERCGFWFDHLEK